jgi:hypothetical protein
LAAACLAKTYVIRRIEGHNGASIQAKDPVEVCDRVEAVRDAQQRAGDLLADRLLNDVVRIVVEGSRRFVQDDQGR